jgi:queuine tRNA-ribosyltransferase
VWSLGALRTITEEGTEFRSHVDGSLCFLSPELSMEIQAELGAEIAMAFDECAPGQATVEEARRSMELSLRWAKRSRDAFDRYRTARYGTARGSERVDAGGLPAGMRALPGAVSGAPAAGNQALFGIVQGATHLDLRRESLERTVEIGFEGYALGGLSVGEEKSAMFDVIGEIGPRMPFDRPRYLMGVGTPEDLIAAVARGMDMFDCVLPTRNGRNGQAFISGGKLNIKNARWTDDQRPLDEACECSVCRRHSRAFLRHLYLTGEMLASVLLTHHNLAFFLDTMRRVRQAIRSGQFAALRRRYTERLGYETE